MAEPSNLTWEIFFNNEKFNGEKWLKALYDILLNKNIFNIF